jgi:hypothetical protein
MEPYCAPKQIRNGANVESKKTVHACLDAPWSEKEEEQDENDYQLQGSCGPSWELLLPIETVIMGSKPIQEMNVCVLLNVNTCLSDNTLGLEW